MIVAQHSRTDSLPQPPNSSSAVATNGAKTSPGHEAWAWAAGELKWVRELMKLRAASDPGAIGEAARYHLNAPGKGIRARLALAAGRALDLPGPWLVSLAAACELTHEASLVHDDIQDGDFYRRGQETVWRRFGEDVAISLGDHFLTCAFELAVEPETLHTVRTQLVRALGRAVREVIRGQTKELTAGLALTPAQYEEISRAKTGPLLSLPLEAALILARANNPTRSAAREVLAGFGVAYQLQDDLADLVGHKGREAAGRDLREGRLDAPLIHFLAEAPAGEARALRAFLDLPREDKAESEVARWVERVRGSRAVPATLAQLGSALDRAAVAARSLPHPLPEVLLPGLRRGLAPLEQILGELPETPELPAA